MFILQYEDGSYYTNLPLQTCLNKRHYDYWTNKGTKMCEWAEELKDDYFKRCRTKDINKAFLFASKGSIRSSNAYTWGGTIYEVKAKTTIEKVL